MLPSIRTLATHRILCLSLTLAPLFATQAVHAQDHQSPVNIIRARAIYDPDFPSFGDTAALNRPLTFTLKNTSWGPWCGTCSGSTDPRWGSLKAYPAEGSAPVIYFGRRSYTLLEFHFHSPAEHLIDGQLAEMEVHFVFKRSDTDNCSFNSLLVIGKRIVAGDENRELNLIFGKDVVLPVNSASPSTKLENFTIGNVTGDLSNSYRYFGSLTAPAEQGCRPPGNPEQQIASGVLPEVVQWVLLKDTIQMSPEQIARFRKLFPNGDARAPQLLNFSGLGKTFRGD